jgi:hypothetical protein
MASNVGKWVGIGCGGCLVLGLVAGAVGYFFVWQPAKTKLTQAGVNFSSDAKQFAGAMMMLGVKQARPKLLQALPAEERTQVEEAITLLDTKVGKFQPKDFRELGDAFKGFTESLKAHGGTPTPEAAHKLGEDLKRLAGRLKDA